MKRFPGGLVALGLLLGGSGQAQADYIFTTIDVPGQAETTAFGINNEGQIVGDYVGADHYHHGFVLSNGSYTALNATGSIATQAFGINNTGQIVGGYADAAGNTHGFLLSGASYTPLDVPRSFGNQLAPPSTSQPSALTTRVMWWVTSRFSRTSAPLGQKPVLSC